MACSDAVRNPSTWGFILSVSCFAILLVACASPWYQETYYTGSVSQFTDLPSNYVMFRSTYNTITCTNNGNVTLPLSAWLPDSWTCSANMLWRPSCQNTIPYLPNAAKCDDIKNHWDVQIGLTGISTIFCGFVVIFFMLRAAVNSFVDRSIIHIIVSICGFAFILGAVGHFPYKYRENFSKSFNCGQLSATQPNPLSGCSNSVWGVNVPTVGGLYASWGPSVGFFVGIAALVLFFFSTIWAFIPYQLPVEGKPAAAAARAQAAEMQQVNVVV